MNVHYDTATHLLDEVARHPAKLDPDQAIRVATAHAILALVPQPTVVNVTTAEVQGDSEEALKRLMERTASSRKWINQ